MSRFDSTRWNRIFAWTGAALAWGSALTATGLEPLRAQQETPEEPLPWHPLPVAFGVVALYGLVVVVGSFYVKKRIGQKAWRVIHFTSFGVFVSSLVHGVTAGTDTRTPVMLGLYLGSALVVAILLGFRLTASETAVPRRRPSSPAEERSTARSVSVVRES